MFGIGKDKGEKRSYEFEGEYQIGSSGNLHRAANIEVEAECCSLMAEIFHAMGQQLERRSEACQRREQHVVEAQAFQAMVSGS